MQKPNFKIVTVLSMLVLLSGCTSFYDATKGWGKKFYNRIDAATTRAQAPKTPPQKAPKDATGTMEGMEGTDRSDPLALTCYRQATGIPLPPTPNSTSAAQIKHTTKVNTTVKKATPEKPKTGATAALSLLPEEKKILSRLSQTPLPQKTPQTQKRGYGLHLASYRKKARAEKGWDNLKKTFATELKGLSPDYPQITLPNKGAFYRIVAGFFPEKARAQQQCKALKAKYQYCNVVKGRAR